VLAHMHMVRMFSRRALLVDDGGERCNSVVTPNVASQAGVSM
jgi:hypothetical protein